MKNVTFTSYVLRKMNSVIQKLKKFVIFSNIFLLKFFTFFIIFSRCQKINLQFFLMIFFFAFLSFFSHRKKINYFVLETCVVVVYI